MKLRYHFALSILIATIATSIVFVLGANTRVPLIEDRGTSPALTGSPPIQIVLTPAPIYSLLPIPLENR